MAIYLVQHGKSQPKEVDPERGLTPEGESDVKRIAGLVKGYGIDVSGIRHSGKTRALQTAEIFAEALGGVDIQKIDGINPNDDVRDFLSNLDNNENTMFVGHLPFLEKLVSYLITDSVEKPVFKFQSGGILCLDKYSGSDAWVIKWALMPKID